MNDITPLPWMSDALCHRIGHPDEWFALNPNQGNSKTARAEALTICDQCPVRDTCLEYALTNGEEWGIWGGKTARQRKVVLRERGGDQIPHGTPKGFYAHNRDGDEPCRSCRAAHNAYERDRYRARKFKTKGLAA